MSLIVAAVVAGTVLVGMLAWRRRFVVSASNRRRRSGRDRGIVSYTPSINAPHRAPSAFSHYGMETVYLADDLGGETSPCNLE